MSKKIFDLIPEALREDLINEVREILKSNGEIINEKKEEPSNKEIDADIEAWANKGKTQ